LFQGRIRFRQVGQLRHATFLVAALVALLVGLLGTCASGASASAAKYRPATVPAVSPSAAAALAWINVTRREHGLAPAQVITNYAANLVRGIHANNDPPFALLTTGTLEEFSLWGTAPYSPDGAPPSPDAVVSAWVNHDGWEGGEGATWNLDCNSPTAPGCNGHRRAILSTPPQPGAQLFIDLVARPVTVDGQQSLGVAALLIWRMPTPRIAASALHSVPTSGKRTTSPVGAAKSK
jgi:hypothetical protein